VGDDVAYDVDGDPFGSLHRPLAAVAYDVADGQLGSDVRRAPRRSVFRSFFRYRHRTLLH
jgi:hypothetical protein